LVLDVVAALLLLLLPSLLCLYELP
jgi:hypothetical protein